MVKTTNTVYKQKELLMGILWPTEHNGALLQFILITHQGINL